MVPDHSRHGRTTVQFETFKAPSDEGADRVKKPRAEKAKECLGMALKASNVVGNPVTLHQIW
jgi:hypothetical protein